MRPLVLPVSLTVFLALSLGGVAKSPPSPDYPFPIDHRLEEVARNLRITPDQLLLARTVLREAARFGIRGVLETRRYDHFSVIQLWDRIDPDNAPAVLEHYLELHRQVAASGTENEYFWATRLAPSLIARLARYEPDKALSYLAWPKPTAPGSTTRAEQLRFQDRIIKDYLTQIAYKDPDHALLELARVRAEWPGLELDYAVRGAIAKQFHEQGRESESIQLIERAFSEFEREEAPDLLVLEDFRHALNWVQSISSDHFASGFALLNAKLLFAGSDGRSRTYELVGPDGDEKVTLSRTDYFLLDTLRGNRSRPEVTDALLESDPRLRELAEQIDFKSFRHYAPLPECTPLRYVAAAKAKSFLAEAREYDQSRMMEPHRPPSTQAVERPFADLSAAPAPPPARRRGPTTPVPREMRKRLKVEFASLDNFDDLLYLASLGGLDQETRREALSVARGVLRDQDSATVRACLMQKIVPVFRRADPESIEGLLDEALALMNNLEVLRREASGETEHGQINQVLAVLRSAVLSEWAIEDVSAAMNYVRSMPELERHSGFGSIARSLTRPTL